MAGRGESNMWAPCCGPGVKWSNETVTGADTTTAVFQHHPNLGAEINRNIAESELQGGVHFGALPRGTKLEVKTRHNVYTIVCDSHIDSGGDSDNDCGADALIYGHPQFCPDPVRAKINGSTWGGSMIWSHFIGRGMHLEFVIPEVGRITTSPIQEIRELAA